jgi:hypothetical protein
MGLLPGRTARNAFGCLLSWHRMASAGRQRLFHSGELPFQSQQTLLGMLLPLPEELEREVRELRLQGCHLSLHLCQPRSQISVSRKFLTFSLIQAGTGEGGRLSRLKNAVMQISQDKDLLTGQALDPCIRRMGVQGYLGLSQPLAERFGIDGEQMTTFDE